MGSLVLPGCPPGMQISTLKPTSSVCQMVWAQQEVSEGISRTADPAWRAPETISEALCCEGGEAVKQLPLKLVPCLPSACYLCSETRQGVPGPLWELVTKCTGCAHRHMISLISSCTTIRTLAQT